MHHTRTRVRRPLRIRIETIHLIRSLLLPNNNFFLFSASSSAIPVALTLVFSFNLMHHLVQYYSGMHAGRACKGAGPERACACEHENA